MDESSICKILVISIIVIFVVASSIGTVNFMHYGLKCDKITKQCDKNEIYESGRYIIGPKYFFV